MGFFLAPFEEGRGEIVFSTFVFTMNRKKLYLLSLISGILFFLSWPPYGIPFLLFIAFVPLLLIEHAFATGETTTKKTMLFGLSFLAFFIWNITSTYWVCNASMGGGAMAILANSFIMAAVVWTFHIVKKRLYPAYCSLLTANWLFAILWLGYEFFHHRWDLTWPWLGLGNAFASVPSCIQWYEYTGVLGGSLWILVANVLLSNFVKSILYKGHTIGGSKTFLFVIAPISRANPMVFRQSGRFGVISSSRTVSLPTCCTASTSQPAMTNR